MSRTARIVAGGVVAGVLVVVALVAAIVAGVSTGLGGAAWETAGVEESAVAEVLDVDDDPGWATVDVRFTTADGEVVVSWVDWEHDANLPAPGEEVDVRYDPLDPEYVFAADDPYVTGGGATVGGGTGAAGDVAGWVSLGALGGLLVTVLVTLVAALRAPAPAPASSWQAVGGPVEWPAQPYAPDDRPGYADPYLTASGHGTTGGQPPRGWSSPG